MGMKSEGYGGVVRDDGSVRHMLLLVRPVLVCWFDLWEVFGRRRVFIVGGWVGKEKR
ncbi:hypothetical protein RHGRI_016580 [Rhododendron griersonianum]|uniref:Transmembrane protein n=1 Tax=Rhododendron griersonianum TaxID=479676 RepID=A0AAV6JUL8_9ERIC|nr:hypothetical protein RHGRI_016580 [Rhododendron griersonianum]